MILQNILSHWGIICMHCFSM